MWVIRTESGYPSPIQYTVKLHITNDFVGYAGCLSGLSQQQRMIYVKQNEHSNKSGLISVKWRAAKNPRNIAVGFISVKWHTAKKV